MTGLVRQGELLSDAPLVSERATDAEGRELLVRRIDPLYAKDQRARDLFLAEIVAAEKIRSAAHPALLAPVLSNDGPEPLLARPFTPHGSLADRLGSSRTIDAAQVASWTCWLAAALDALHALGLAHGDPSPRNVLLFAHDGDPRLADPASSRRLFALERGDGDAMARDQAAAMRLLETLLERQETPGGGDDEPTLLGELQRIRYCNLPLAGKLEAVRRLAPHAPPPAAPVPDGRGGDQAPGATRVILVAGPFKETAARHQVSRWTLSYATRTGADVRAFAEPARIAVELDYPEPCRTLASHIRALGAPVTVAARVRGRLPDLTARAERRP